MTASTDTVEVAAEKPKAKRVLRPIIVPGKIVQIESPVHEPFSYTEKNTQPGEIVLVDAVMSNGIVAVLDANFLSKRFVKKGSKLKIVKKPDQQKFMETLRKSTKTISIYGPTKPLTGFDPEVFAVDEAGVVIPAFKYLPPKDNPIRFDAFSGTTGENKVFWDGFQAEFATAGASSCHAYSVDNIQKSLERIFNESRKFNPGSTLTHKCVLDVPFGMMQECSPEQVGLGCSPSKNVYGEKKHLESLNPSELQFRFAGCHLHYGTGAEANNELMVKMLDAIAGVSSVAILSGMEDDRRRKFYGLAGEYRLPKHGLEYRVLSSAILAHPILMIFFLDFTRQIVGNVQKLSIIWDGNEDETQDVINTLDFERAKKIIKRNEVTIKAMLHGCYGDCYSKKVFNLFEKGAMNCLPIGNMEENWLFNKYWVTHSNSTNCSVCKWVS